MRKISGRVFFYIPLLLVLILFMYSKYKTGSEGYKNFCEGLVWLTMIAHNLIGLVIFSINYTRTGMKEDCVPGYKFNIENYVKRSRIPNLFNYNEKENYYNYYIPYIRLSCIVCWFLYFIMAADTFFNEKLTINIPNNE